jgi:ABC-type branched-subunit amino acid transport system substrate-binding protein
MVTGKLAHRGRATARSVALVIVTAIALGVAALPASSVTPRAEAAKATEIGITPTTIRVAVVADVDNTIVPGVLQGIVDGVEGWGKYVNANGGIAGRKVQVDFIDSHLNPNDARNAIIKACSEDFALVGTSALLLANANDEISCADQAGAATGLPDMGAIVTASSQACSPVSFPILSQTFRYNVGDAKYHIKAVGKLHGSYSVAVDSPSVKIGSFAISQAYQKAGIKADHEPWQVTGRDLQSSYTPIIQDMKNNLSNFALTLQAVNGVVEERQEAKLQGLTDPKIVWDCTLACYFSPVFTGAGQAVDGEYMPLTFLPFDETAANPMVKNFVKYVGKSKLSGFANNGFTAGVLFEQAAKDAVAKHGNNGLTRANLLEALKGTTAFNAGGMVGTQNVGQKIPSPCFMVEQWKGGAFHRVYPTKKGTFDCKPSNLVTFKADLYGTT